MAVGKAKHICGAAHGLAALPVYPLLTGAFDDQRQGVTRGFYTKIAEHQIALRGRRRNKATADVDSMATRSLRFFIRAPGIVQRPASRLNSNHRALMASFRPQAGQEVNAGVTVRLASVQAVAGALGVFDTTHEYETPKELADHLRAASRKYYGTALPAFIAEYIKHKDAYNETINARCKAFMDRHLKGKDAAGQTWSVCHRFALVAVAGELATRFRRPSFVGPILLTTLSPSSPQRSTQATDRPRRHDVELAPSDTLQQRIQSRPLVAAPGATDALVAVDRHDRPAKPSSGLLERL